MYIRCVDKFRKANFFFITLYCLGSFFACKKESAFIQDPTHTEKITGADATLRNFTAEAFRDGRLLWRAAAEEAYLVQIRDETYLFNTRLEYFETNPKSRDYSKSTIVNAKKVILQKGNKFMQISGNVLVNAPHNRRLKTEELFWDESKNSLYSNVAVTIDDGMGNIITGTRGVKTDRTLSRTVFKGGVGSGIANF